MDTNTLLTVIFGVAGGGGWVGAAIAMYRLVTKGKLYPSSMVDKIRSDFQDSQDELRGQWEARLAESSTREHWWRQAYDLERQRGDVMARQIDTLMDYAKTTDAVLRALPGGRAAA